MRVAFVCVQNAGRSQMATAFADRERRRRGLGDSVETITGGTRPADHVHEAVIEAMAEVGLDLSERIPREITVEELQGADVVVTMGCSAEDVCPATWGGDSRDWDLDDPHGKPLREVREIRDEIGERVRDLLDELLTEREGSG
jgi:protein-tyrosine-phosphatase